MHCLFAAWYDFLPESIRGVLDGPLGIVVLLVVGAVAIFLLAWGFSIAWRMVVGTSSGSRTREKKEILANYPPPPPVSITPKKLYVEGTRVRIRLLIVAPAGKELIITQDNVKGLMSEVVEDLGAIVNNDKPRIIIWPPQLSLQGFAPTFHRAVETPEAAGESSPWIVLAGPARVGPKKMLIGIALLSEKHMMMGRRDIEMERWHEILTVK